MSNKDKGTQAKNMLLSKASALGNSHYGLKEVCSDLLNDFGRDKGKMRVLQDGTFLSSHTLDRMMTLSEAESGEPYRPNAETCERILRFFNSKIVFETVKITPKYSNKPKRET